MTVSDDELIARLENPNHAKSQTFALMYMREAAARLRSLSESKRKAEAECDRLRAAISWIEPPFVDDLTPDAELRFRAKQCVKDAARAVIAKEAGHAE